MFDKLKNYVLNLSCKIYLVYYLKLNYLINDNIILNKKIKLKNN